MYSAIHSANFVGIITLLLTPGFTSESGNQIEWRQRDMDNDKELKLHIVQKNYVEERKPKVINGSFAKSQVEQRQNDFNEAENFGILAANEFFEIEEPKLFKLGIFLKSNEPASYLGAFNRQTDEAKHISKVAYAALKASKKLIEKYGNGTNRISPSDLERDSTTLWSHQHIGLRQLCPRRDAPHCPIASLKYRTADGTCNNREHLWWGSAMSTMQRLLPPVYDNGVDSIRRSVNIGKALPSPRDVSAIIHEDKDVPLASITHMLMQWGQFVDHDMTATAQSQGFNGTFPQCCRRGGTEFQLPELTHPDCLPIPVSPQDNFFGPLGVRCLEFVRSGPAPREDCGFGPREQLSQVTSYLDGSMIYSSHPGLSDSLRIFRGGLLQYGKLRTRRPLQSQTESDDICRRGSLLSSCFRPGDARLSENPALTSLHVVFLRIHNDIATELSRLNSHWPDEKIFQETRKIVGALIQHITYHEFLPIIIGPEVMKIFELELLRTGYYNGYDSTVNPDIANSFSTAAYRFGHSLVQEKFFRYDNQHHLISNNVSMHGEFGNRQDLHSPGSVDRLLLGLVNQPAQRRDECITKELTNHLFQFPNARFGMDLAAINIQRGRDHGLPPYIKWREPCGLSKLLDWQDLERAIPSSIVRKMKRVYSSIEDIDLFTGGLSEKSVLGGLVGPTFACIIAQQFSNTKKGDRFWYENGMQPNSFTPAQLHQIRRTTLAQILCRVLDNVHSIQRFVFLTSDIFGNEILPCNNPKLGQWNFQAWIDRKKSAEKTISSSTINIDGNIYDYINKSHQMAEQAKTFGNKKLKPVQTNVHQKNRIIVKRPVGTSHDNVTIVVNNHAVNSPIFVNDAIYGSNFHTMLPSIPISTISPPLPSVPTSISNNDETNEEINYFSTSGSSNSYIPVSLQDPNNPNSFQRPIASLTPEQPINYGKVQSNHRHDTWVNIGPLLDQLKPNWYTPLGNQPTTNYEIRVHTREKAPKTTNDQYEVPKPLLQHNIRNTDKNNNYQDNVNDNNNNVMITEKNSVTDENIFELWSDSTIISNKNSNTESDEIPKPIKLKNKENNYQS